MILDPNGMPILQPAVDNAETATFNDAFAAIGNTRQIKTYKWADNAARTAQTGMTAGDEGYQTDTDTYYTYDGAAWVEAIPEVQLRLDTTNSVIRPITQVGIGMKAATATLNMAMTVTFPVAFDSIPVVSANYIGTRTPNGAFDPAGLGSTNFRSLVGVTDITTTNFVATFSRYDGANLSSGSDYYLNWSAVGVPA